MVVNQIYDDQIYDDTIISSDNQSLLTSIDSLNPHTKDIRKTLASLHGTTYLHWIPGHFKARTSLGMNALTKQLKKCSKTVGP